MPHLRLGDGALMVSCSHSWLLGLLVNGHQLHVRGPVRGSDFFRVSDICRKRLFAKHVHLISRGTHRELLVEQIGRCDVDGIDAAGA